MSKKILFIIIYLITIFIVALLSACSNNFESTTSTDFMMGTLVKVKVYGADSKKVTEEVIAEIKHLENMMSTSIKDSDISKINKNAGQQAVRVSKDTFTVIKKAQKFARLTDGLFDPSIGPLVNIWGIGTSEEKIPTKNEINKILPLVNYKNIILDNDKMTVYLTKPDMKIDVGGIAKGYAADKAVSILKKHNIKHAFIDIGGNVMVHGKKPDNSLWSIGIQNPRGNRNEIMAVVKLASKTVVTSGDYERYFIKNNKRYHHILNPKTGYPTSNNIISATVIDESSLIADALATSILLLGEKKGLKLAEQLDCDAMLITNKKELFMTDGMKKLINVTDEVYQILTRIYID